MYKTNPSNLKGWDHITKARLKVLISKAIESGKKEVNLNHWTFDLEEAQTFLEEE